ncbi:MAG: YCF48-related protein [Thermodesulfovibrionia bacterium]|nr:YCF48-related protein [Thermodesulfovibrionia bacterium]
MANIILFIILSIFIVLSPSAGSGYDTTSDFIWEYSSHGIKDTELLNISITPDNPNKIFVSSYDTIYLTYDSGVNWKEILSFKGTGNTINSVTLSSEDPKIVYIGTSGGLYRSKDEGYSWEELFKGSGTLENAVLSVAVHPDNDEIIYIGVKAGLFRTDNKGKDWLKILSLPSKNGVSIISINNIDPNIIYAASGNDLYRSEDSGMNWALIYRTGYYTEKSSDELELSDQDDTTDIDILYSMLIKSVALSTHEINVIYIGTFEGLLKSDDRGETWSNVSDFGQLSRNINHIIVNPDDTDILYSATDRGVFKYSRQSDRWEELYKGIKATAINRLATVSSSMKDSVTLWAATDKGVYKTVRKPAHSFHKDNNLIAENYLSYFDNEPSIEDIQKAAIEYAEVNPDKIRKWSDAAARKAWLPDLKIDYGIGKNWQSSTYFYSTSSEKYKDDDVTDGKDDGWSISMTWELGDLIWNSDQTSIDTRSRLMTQLRDDVLNDVTRLYYERRRLQIEILLYPPELIEEKIEKDLRLEELTADINAMTGYSLSNKLSNEE